MHLYVVHDDYNVTYIVLLYLPVYLPNAGIVCDAIFNPSNRHHCNGRICMVCGVRVSAYYLFDTDVAHNDTSKARSKVNAKKTIEHQMKINQFIKRHRKWL